MKTVTITSAQPELGKLVEEVYRGAEVILVYGDKKVRLEPCGTDDSSVDLNLEEDSSELEAELLKGVRGKFTPYSPKDLEEIAESVKREKAGS
jgi:hypothetical protein